MTKSDLAPLHRLLQCALELELFTVPLYLTALYSIPAGANGEAADILQGVAMEEMLHMGMIANVLNAVGGHPAIDSARVTGLAEQGYPSTIPHIESDREMDLLPLSKNAVENFAYIESPERVEPTPGDGFETIGEFYDKVKRTLIDLCEDNSEQQVFCGHASLQLEPTNAYYGGGGELISVSSLNEALSCLEIVSEQGEGRRDRGTMRSLGNLSGDHLRFGQPKDAAHYYRFRQILEERFYGEENNVSDQPRGERFAVDWNAVHPCVGSPARPEITSAFTAAYGELLAALHDSFNGRPDKISGAIHKMFQVKEEAVRLMRIPARESRQTIKPPFWYVLSA